MEIRPRSIIPTIHGDGKNIRRVDTKLLAVWSNLRRLQRFRKNRPQTAKSPKNKENHNSQGVLKCLEIHGFEIARGFFAAFLLKKGSSLDSRLEPAFLSFEAGAQAGHAVEKTDGISRDIPMFRFEMQMRVACLPSSKHRRGRTAPAKASEHKITATIISSEYWR